MVPSGSQAALPATSRAAGGNWDQPAAPSNGRKAAAPAKPARKMPAIQYPAKTLSERLLDMKNMDVSMLFTNVVEWTQENWAKAAGMAAAAVVLIFGGIWVHRRRHPPAHRPAQRAGQPRLLHRRRRS